MAYLAVLSLDRGRPAGYAAVAGVALGLLLLGLAAGFGAGTIISETRWLYEVLRWGGVAYLLLLAWDSYRQAQAPIDPAKGVELASGFRRGLISNLLNPKAALFYVTVLPNFVDAARPAGPQSLVLTLVYVAVATVVHAVIVLAAGTFRPWLTSERVRRTMGVVFGLVLVGIAIWLALATRRVW
jgi:threonine/homoserine/homoserine lactone efflux protein